MTTTTPSADTLTAERYKALKRQIMSRSMVPTFFAKVVADIEETDVDSLIADREKAETGPAGHTYFVTRGDGPEQEVTVVEFIEAAALAGAWRSPALERSGLVLHTDFTGEYNGRRITGRVDQAERTDG